MGERERFLFVMVYLLQQEIKCLRSVLSEYGAEHSQFTQWMIAEDLRRVIESQEYKL